MNNKQLEPDYLDYNDIRNKPEAMDIRERMEKFAIDLYENGWTKEYIYTAFHKIIDDALYRAEIEITL